MPVVVEPPRAVVMAASLLFFSFAACRRNGAAFDADFRVLHAIVDRSALPADPAALDALRVRYHRAVDDAQERFNKNPNNADGAWKTGELERVGYLLDAQGAADQAEHYLRLALALRPDDKATHLSLGFLYLAGGTDAAPRAEQEFRQAIEGAASPAPEAYKGLFLSYYYQGRWADALPAADRYLAARPADTDFQKMRAMDASNATRGRETKS